MAIIVVPKDAPTIQAAVTAAQPGDLVFVKKRKYHESVDVVGKNSIAILAENGAVLDGKNSLLHGFSVSNSSNIEIKGFRIQNYVEFGIRERPRSFNTNYVQNNIKKIGMDGIIIESTSELETNRLIWKNKINNATRNGINVLDPFCNIVENEIKNVGNNGIVMNFAVIGIIFGNIVDKTGSEGILVQSSFATGFQILQNSVVHSNGNGIVLNNPLGLLFSKNSSNHNDKNGIVINADPVFRPDGFNFIEENRSLDNQDDGIQVNQNNNFIIRNKAKDNGDDGIYLNSNNNEVVQNITCDNEDDNIDNDGAGNSFLKNKKC